VRLWELRDYPRALPPDQPDVGKPMIGRRCSTMQSLVFRQANDKRWSISPLKNSLLQRLRPRRGGPKVRSESICTELSSRCRLG
jgi:hypothetical protein